jgi:hypothetical protein
MSVNKLVVKKNDNGKATRLLERHNFIADRNINNNFFYTNNNDIEPVGYNETQLHTINFKNISGKLPSYIMRNN